MILHFGLFIGIEDGIDGLIHISDISWTERIKHPSDKFNKGDEVEAKILQIDGEGEKFSLGIKQLTEDPWVKAARDLPPGTKGSGTITKLTDFGVFVEISPGIEGMVHVSELDVNIVSKAEEIVKAGDKIDFVILSSNSEERRFSLSRKAHMKGLEGEKLTEYLDTFKEPQTAFADAFSQAQDLVEDKKDTSEKVDK